MNTFPVRIPPVVPTSTAAVGIDQQRSGSISETLSTARRAELKLEDHHRLSFHRPNYYPPLYHTVHGEQARQRRLDSEMARQKAKDGADAVCTDNSFILKNGNFSKGTGFTERERQAFRLEGLLPCVIESMDQQLVRVYKQFTSFNDPINRHVYLSNLRNSNATLFYKFVLTHLKECLPIVYTPTVGQACLEFSLQFRAAEGMYISGFRHKGRIESILYNWRNNIADDVAIIVVTDGSRILGLGDLGACGMGIPIGKISLYVAAGGFHPLLALPVVLDMGTNNESLLTDPLYVGERHVRLTGDEYYSIIDEFMTAIHNRWPYALVQFEDFSNDHCFEILERWKHKAFCFNDDIQGTGVVIAAGLLNAMKHCQLDYTKTKFMVVGAGSAGIGIVRQTIKLITYVVIREGRSSTIPTEEELIQNIFLIDSKGLVHSKRSDVDTLAYFKKPFAHNLDFEIPEDPDKLKDLTSLVSIIRPHALIGLSGQGGIFTNDVLKEMAKVNPKPIIFPLSNPTSKSECLLSDAVTATNGTCIFASGSPMPEFEMNGKVYQGSQGNNLYAFPGIGFGACMVKAHLVSDAMFTAAALAISDSTEPSRLELGLLYPDLNNIRDVSVKVATAVALQAFDEGLCVLPASIPIADDDDTKVRRCLEDYMRSQMYQPVYLDIVEDSAA